jgi:hypothetical protein
MADPVRSTCEPCWFNVTFAVKHIHNSFTTTSGSAAWQVFWSLFLCVRPQDPLSSWSYLILPILQNTPIVLQPGCIPRTNKKWSMGFQHFDLWANWCMAWGVPSHSSGHGSNKVQLLFGWIDQAQESLCILELQGRCPWTVPVHTVFPQAH